MTKEIVREDGPFLIWSHTHEAWYCSPSVGGSGYTNDLSKAGVFGYHLAKQLHDTHSFPVRDEAVSLSQAKHHLLARQAELRSQMAQCQSMLDRIPSPRPKGRPKKE